VIAFRIDSLTAENNLALALCDAGHCEEAAGIFRHVLAGRKRALGDEHQDTLNASNNLAGALRRCGQHAEVVDLYLDSHTVLSRILGKTHPNTLIISSNLAVSFSDVGRYAEAVEHQCTVVASRHSSLGVDDVKTKESARFLDLLLRASTSENETTSTPSTAAPPSGTSGQNSADIVLAVLLQAVVPFDQAQLYLERFVARGFDCMATLQTLTEADLAGMSVEAGHRQRILDILQCERQEDVQLATDLKSSSIASSPPLANDMQSQTTANLAIVKAASGTATANPSIPFVAHSVEHPSPPRKRRKLPESFALRTAVHQSDREVVPEAEFERN